MSDAVSIDFPRIEVDRLFAQMQRAQKELGKGLKNSVAWAGSLLMQSLAAQTIVSQKLRPIVSNPDKRHKTDKRFAPFGVFRYDRTGKKYFKPIYRTGEYGRIRFIDKKTAEVKYINTLTGKVHRAEQVDQEPGMSIKSDKRRIIGRRGLAKKSWQWAAKHMAGGIANLMRVPNLASIKWIGGADNPAVKIENDLRYMRFALKGGYAALNTAAANAARKMAKLIEDRIVRKMEAA